MSKPLIVAVGLLGCLMAMPASAGVTISCFRGPVKQSALINGAKESFAKSIFETYDVTMDVARAIADSVCSDLSAVDDDDRLVELTKTRLTGLQRR